MQTYWPIFMFKPSVRQKQNRQKADVRPDNIYAIYKAYISWKKWLIKDLYKINKASDKDISKFLQLRNTNGS